uniref:Uncharacterized protein n=1 Tax=Lepeophtheirus salmonis TaxID=72036 RepID=A0A0K2V8X1_LEPSM
MSQKSRIDKSMGSCRTILLLIITKMFLMSNFSNLAVKVRGFYIIYTSLFTWYSWIL